MKNQKGITLVALIITIIVMVILAGVIIASAVADGGIIQRAQGAMKEKERAEIEELIIASYEYKTGASTGNVYAYLDLNATAGNIWDNLTNNGFILQDGSGNEYGNKEGFLDDQEGSDGIIDDKIDLNVEGKHGNYEGTVADKGLEHLKPIEGEKEPTDDNEDDKGNNDDNNNVEKEDFTINVTQSEVGSPVTAISLSIRPNIPDSWKKTEFTEEEAVEIVNKETLNISNITNLEDYDKELYNFLNDMSGISINGEDDVSDFNALKTVISSKITLGEDPQNEIFSYLMGLIGANYSTVYDAAVEMYEYEPIEYNYKIRKENGEWIDITSKSYWKAVTYEVDTDGIYEIQIELDDKKAITEVDVYLPEVPKENNIIAYGTEDIHFVVFLDTNEIMAISNGNVSIAKSKYTLYSRITKISGFENWKITDSSLEGYMYMKIEGDDSGIILAIKSDNSKLAYVHFDHSSGNRIYTNSTWTFEKNSEIDISPYL